MSTSGWTQRTVDGVCLKEDPSGDGGGGPVTITAPVGSGGVNRLDDVKRIQEALNQIPPEKGGPAPPLVVDGICGPKTTGAILKFQKAQGVVADGRIDPGYPTLARLNAALGTGEAGGGRRERVLGFVADAFRTVRAAQATLLMARPLLASPGGADGTPGDSARQERLALLERHFRISEQPSPQGTADKLLRIYDRMRECFTRPGGLWGPAVFADAPVPSPVGPKTVACTFAGGYDCGGQLWGRLRKDTIYLCARLDTLPNDQVVMTIVHELAHFVGPTVVGAIEDHAYGWVDRARMKTLPAAWRPFNAECYNNFAFEAHYRRAPAR